MRIPHLLVGLVIVLTAEAQEYATARIMESQFKKASFIHISYENGEQETLDLIDWNLMSGVGNVASTMQENQRTFTKMIGTMRAKGYELIQSSESSTDSYLLTLMIFRKNE
jgi:hypothetical protein